MSRTPREHPDEPTDHCVAASGPWNHRPQGDGAVSVHSRVHDQLIPCGLRLPRLRGAVGNRVGIGAYWVATLLVDRNPAKHVLLFMLFWACGAGFLFSLARSTEMVQPTLQRAAAPIIVGDFVLLDELANKLCRAAATRTDCDVFPGSICWAITCPMRSPSTCMSQGCRFDVQVSLSNPRGSPGPSTLFSRWKPPQVSCPSTADVLSASIL